MSAANPYYRRAWLCCIRAAPTHSLSINSFILNNVCGFARVGLSWAAPGTELNGRSFIKLRTERSQQTATSHTYRGVNPPHPLCFTPTKANKYNPPLPLAHSRLINSLRCVSVGVSWMIAYRGSSICGRVALWMVSVSLFNTVGECEGWGSCCWCLLMCSHIEVLCFASSCVSVLRSPDKFHLKG